MKQLTTFNIFLTGIAIWLIAYMINSPLIPPCPNCHIKDSLYLECNGTIKRWNEDTVSYFKNDIR